MYSYNDAYFSEGDWKGIRMIGESLKEKDPLKVGRFGLGFKSIYHITGKTMCNRFRFLDAPIFMRELGIIKASTSSKILKVSLEKFLISEAQNASDGIGVL